jgi:hypothetical protein
VNLLRCFEYSVSQTQVVTIIPLCRCSDSAPRRPDCDMYDSREHRREESRDDRFALKDILPEAKDLAWESTAVETI